MDFTGSMAASREPQRILSGELLASHLAAFDAMDCKRRCLDGESRKYSQLLERLQQMTNSKALEFPNLLMSCEVQGPVTAEGLAAVIETQLLRRLQSKIRSSLARLAELDRDMVVAASAQGKKRKFTAKK